MLKSMNNKKKLFVKEQIKALFLWRDISMSEVVRKLNEIKNKNLSVSNLSHKLSKETIPFKEVLEIADLLGYEVVFKPKTNWESWDIKKK